MTATTIPNLNGVDIDAIRGARAALTDTPPAAKLQWRAEAEWVSGTHTSTTVEKFFGLGEEHAHRQAFTYSTDHPEVFASEDHGSTPVEILLVGLAGCLGGGIATIAANRGLRLERVKATLTADQDLLGVMGIDPDVRNGFSGIDVCYEIDADATREEIEALVAQSQKRSAVYDMLTNPTSVSVTVA